MENLSYEKRTFGELPYARYGTEFTFTRSFTPVGSLQEGKLHFSSNQTLYWYKVEVSVFSIGLASIPTNHHPGTVYDLEMFQKQKCSETS